MQFGEQGRLTASARSVQDEVLPAAQAHHQGGFELFDINGHRPGQLCVVVGNRADMNMPVLGELQILPQVHAHGRSCR
jgi:hypothetical protein